MQTKEKIESLFQNKIEHLNANLIEAKLTYAESHLDENDWQNKSDRKVDCKTIQAQIEILQSMEFLIGDIFDTCTKTPV